MLGCIWPTVCALSRYVRGRSVPGLAAGPRRLLEAACVEAALSLGSIPRVAPPPGCRGHLVSLQVGRAQDVAAQLAGLRGEPAYLLLARSHGPGCVVWLGRLSGFGLPVDIHRHSGRGGGAFW